MHTKIAMISAGILVAGLMVVASYTSSVWAATISSGSSSTSAAGGAGTSLEDSSSVGGSTAGAAGYIAICGHTVKIHGACSSGDP